MGLSAGDAVGDLSFGLATSLAEPFGQLLGIGADRHHPHGAQPASGLINHASRDIDDHPAAGGKILQGLRGNAVAKAVGPPGQGVVAGGFTTPEFRLAHRPMVLAARLGRTGDVTADEYDPGIIGERNAGAVK